MRGARIQYAGGLVGLGASVAIALWSMQAAVIAGGVVLVGCGLACAFVMPETGFVRASRGERSRVSELTTAIQEDAVARQAATEELRRVLTQ